jgi:hypothetical protein
LELFLNLLPQILPAAPLLIAKTPAKTPFEVSMLPASTPILDPAIALEITISEPLFRQLQTVLDADPSLSLDDLASKALTLYLGIRALLSTEAN